MEVVSEDEEKKSPAGKKKRERKDKRNGDGSQPSIMSMFAKM